MIHAREDYNKGKMSEIPKDEPVFLLRAQDELAADVVRFWCRRAYETGVDEKMIELAENHADLMDQWPTKKGADM